MYAGGTYGGGLGDRGETGASATGPLGISEAELSLDSSSDRSSGEGDFGRSGRSRK